MKIASDAEHVRLEEPGWEKIGVTCSAGRRSLWWRVHEEDAGENIIAFELAAGREGNDAHVRIENDGSREFYDLYTVFETAQFAAET